MRHSLWRGLAIVFIALAVTARAAQTPATALPRLKVSDNRRFLVTADGRPFFWLGDTAWELFHRLEPRGGRALPAATARRCGFTVIQAVALAEFDGLTTPNAYGDTPLVDNDPTRPNEAYFAHVDWIVPAANALGLYVGLLPDLGRQVEQEVGRRPGDLHAGERRARTASGSAAATRTPA